MRDVHGEVEVAATRWRVARRDFLALPSGSPDARDKLNALAKAESDLCVAVDTMLIHGPLVAVSHA